MLVLARGPGQSIVIGHDITVRVIEVSGDAVRIGVVAPTEVGVHREEIYERIRDANIEAAASAPEPLTGPTPEAAEGL